MNSFTRLGWTALILAAAVIVADQAAKAWILSSVNLPLLISKQFAGPLYLTMVWNPGVSFVGGFLQAHKEIVRWVLTAFSAGVSAATNTQAARIISAWALMQHLRKAGCQLMTLK